MNNKKKIILIVALISFFTVGFTIGHKTVRRNAINKCAELLEGVEVEDIDDYKIDKDNIITIYLNITHQEYIDRTEQHCPNFYEREDLKDSLQVKDVQIIYYGG